MTQYIDDMGKIVTVSDGISPGTHWASYRIKKTESLQRIKTKYLPERKTQIEAEADLELYAQKMGWKIKNVFLPTKPLPPQGRIISELRGQRKKM